MKAVCHPIDREGVWCQVLRTVPGGLPALFLDRDGVLVEETGYLSRTADIQMIEGAAELVAHANKENIPVVLVTNQAGIGRGYYDWEAFDAVQREIIARLAASGAELDAVYACPHHPLGKNAFGNPDHPDRKPNPGMLLRAAENFDLDLSRSWLIGDKASDILAAKRASLAGGMLVTTGYGLEQTADVLGLAEPGFEVVVGCKLADAKSLPLFACRRYGAF